MPSFQYLQRSVSLHYVHTVGVLNDPDDHTRHILRHTTLLYKVLKKLSMLSTLWLVNFKTSLQYSFYVFLWIHLLTYNIYVILSQEE